MERRDERLLIVQKPNSLPKLSYSKIDLLEVLLCKSLTTLLCSLLYLSISSALGSLIACSLKGSIIFYNEVSDILGYIFSLGKSSLWNTGLHDFHHFIVPVCSIISC